MEEKRLKIPKVHELFSIIRGVDLELNQVVEIQFTINGKKQWIAGVVNEIVDKTAFKYKAKFIDFDEELREYKEEIYPFTAGANSKNVRLPLLHNKERRVFQEERKQEERKEEVAEEEV